MDNNNSSQPAYSQMPLNDLESFHFINVLFHHVSTRFRSSNNYWFLYENFKNNGTQKKKLEMDDTHVHTQIAMCVVLLFKFDNIELV